MTLMTRFLDKMYSEPKLGTWGLVPLHVAKRLDFHVNNSRFQHGGDVGERMRYQTKSQTREELLACIMHAATEIKDSRMQLRKATSAVHKRAAKCIEADGDIFLNIVAATIRRPEFECSGPQLEGPEFECSGPQLEGPEFEYSELSLKVRGANNEKIPICSFFCALVGIGQCRLKIIASNTLVGKPTKERWGEDRSLQLIEKAYAHAPSGVLAYVTNTKPCAVKSGKSLDSGHALDVSFSVTNLNTSESATKVPKFSYKYQNDTHSQSNNQNL
ncbi:hypothetical protein ANN_04893 [Periplaneta americana]|uniref:Uncharacterized protein n=1 Tax=Periplaneta americana TaxID=6978 RepID=A0ABQ8TBJ9_PERAM|nr:hypothetical protein ANN_04893 [Periplaneta americana]